MKSRSAKSRQNLSFLFMLLVGTSYFFYLYKTKKNEISTRKTEASKSIVLSDIKKPSTISSYPWVHLPGSESSEWRDLLKESTKSFPGSNTILLLGHHEVLGIKTCDNKEFCQEKNKILIKSHQLKDNKSYSVQSFLLDLPSDWRVKKQPFFRIAYQSLSYRYSFSDVKEKEIIKTYLLKEFEKLKSKWILIQDLFKRKGPILDRKIQEWHQLQFQGVILVKALNQIGEEVFFKVSKHIDSLFSLSSSVKREHFQKEWERLQGVAALKKRERLDLFKRTQWSYFSKEVLAQILEREKSSQISFASSFMCMSCEEIMRLSFRENKEKFSLDQKGRRLHFKKLLKEIEAVIVEDGLIKKVKVGIYPKYPQNAYPRKADSRIEFIRLK